MTPAVIWRRAYDTFKYPVAIGIAISTVATLGYWHISGYQATLLDCVYMAYITITSIGYEEVVDLSHSPGGRVFNMAISAAGIATLAYTFSKFTAFIIESQFSEALRRRRMQDRINTLTGHYIVCGIGRVGTNVARELELTQRPYVVIEDAEAAVAVFRERTPDALTIHGDSSHDEMLRAAGVARAAGVFAVTGDDGKNLIITLTAKQLNPAARVVARCHEVRNIDKLKRVGADAIVSPEFTGSMRIASSMLRPTVVNFLDEMLRTDSSLRVEEVVLPDGSLERRLAQAAPPSRDYVVLAVRRAERWEFNPAAETLLRAGDRIVAMTTPEGRIQLAARVAA